MNAWNEWVNEVLNLLYPPRFYWLCYDTVWVLDERHYYDNVMSMSGEIKFVWILCWYMYSFITCSKHLLFQGSTECMYLAQILYCKAFPPYELMISVWQSIRPSVVHSWFTFAFKFWYLLCNPTTVMIRLSGHGNFVPVWYFRINEFSGLLNRPLGGTWKLVPTLLFGLARFPDYRSPN